MFLFSVYAQGATIYLTKNQSFLQSRGAGYLLCAFEKYLSSGETMACSFNEFPYKLNMQCPRKSVPAGVVVEYPKIAYIWYGTLHIFLYIMNTE